MPFLIAHMVGRCVCANSAPPIARDLTSQIRVFICNALDFPRNWMMCLSCGTRVILRRTYIMNQNTRTSYKICKDASSGSSAPQKLHFLYILPFHSASIKRSTFLNLFSGLTIVHFCTTRPSLPPASSLEGCFPVSMIFSSTPAE